MLCNTAKGIRMAHNNVIYIYMYYVLYIASLYPTLTSQTIPDSNTPHSLLRPLHILPIYITVP